MFSLCAHVLVVYEHARGSFLGPCQGDLIFRTRPLVCSGPRHKLSAVVKSVRPKRPIHGCQGHLAADLTACVTADTSVKQRNDHKQTPSSNGCGLLLWSLDWGVSRTRTKGGCKSPPLPRPEFQRGEFSQVQVPGAPRRTGAGGWERRWGAGLPGRLCPGWSR